MSAVAYATIASYCFFGALGFGLGAIIADSPTYLAISLKLGLLAIAAGLEAHHLVCKQES